MTEDPIELSIIIVSYRTRDLLRTCLESIERTYRESHEVFVVDNASDDGSAEMVRERFPLTHLIVNRVNVGYAKANNQAIRRARGRYVLLLNSDTMVYPDTFSSTLAYMRAHPEVGILTCKVEKPDGTLDLACRRSFPTPIVALWRLTGLSSLFPRSRYFARYNLTYLDENETYEVDAVVGAYMLMDRAAMWRVGLLDESFFMYGEDLDWCYRFRQEGYKVVYYPEVKILHYKGASSLNRSTPRMIREFHRAMHLFYRKYFSTRHFFLTNWIIRIGVDLHCRAQFLQSRGTTAWEKVRLAVFN